MENMDNATLASDFWPPHPSSATQEVPGIGFIIHNSRDHNGEHMLLASCICEGHILGALLRNHGNVRRWNQVSQIQDLSLALMILLLFVLT